MLADEQLGDPALTDALFPPYTDRCRSSRRRRRAGRPAGAAAASTGDGGCRAHGAEPDPAATPRGADVARVGGGSSTLAGLDGGSGLAATTRWARTTG
jgi:hypothetical protein